MKQKISSWFVALATLAGAAAQAQDPIAVTNYNWLQLRPGTDDALLAASEPQPVTFQQKDGLPLPQSNGMSLESLAPGDYELRVVVVDRKADATAFRSVEFTLE